MKKSYIILIICILILSQTSKILSSLGIDLDSILLWQEYLIMLILLIPILVLLYLLSKDDKIKNRLDSFVGILYGFL